MECRGALAGVPVTGTVARVACWPLASAQLTPSAVSGVADGAGAAERLGAADGSAAAPWFGTVVDTGAGDGGDAPAVPGVSTRERPAAVRVRSPGMVGVSEGAGPEVRSTSPPRTGTRAARRVAPGHRTLAPSGPSTASMLSLVAALTVAE
jgi:hypothetical protein